jgi:hypothetical protein
MVSCLTRSSALDFTRAASQSRGQQIIVKGVHFATENMISGVTGTKITSNLFMKTAGPPCADGSRSATSHLTTRGRACVDEITAAHTALEAPLNPEVVQLTQVHTASLTGC